MKNCPYYELPESSFWNTAVGNFASDAIDPHTTNLLKITRQHKIGSAGSCFAQHISRALAKSGYRYYVVEGPPAFINEERLSSYNYGVFSARFGNIYSTLQLLQLVQRAFGLLHPHDQFWMNQDGRCFDLLRPRINPNGFASRLEAEADNQRHLAAVRHMFQTMDVFIFTLGLTEAWISKADGVVYPTCPGCGSAGTYDSKQYKFHNLSVAETTDSLSAAIEIIKEANPNINIILTVSPVPLMATMENRHVLQATVYSKSVLRVAAEEIIRKYSFAHYFASYELITATRNAHKYFSGDGRTVVNDAVEKVMAIFFSHFCDPLGDNRQSISEGGDVRDGSKFDLPPNPVCDEDDFYKNLARKVGI